MTSAASRKTACVRYCRGCDRRLVQINDAFACTASGVNADAALVLRAIRGLSLTLASGVSLPAVGWGIKRLGRSPSLHQSELDQRPPTGSP